MDYRVPNIYGKTKNDAVTVSVPGSKSITARALLLAALADGESTLCGAQFSKDCKTFLNCLQSLGIECAVSGNTVKIKGCGGRLAARSGRIDVGSAGTAARFLPAFLAFQSGKFEVDASSQMKARPIAPLIATLEQLGAKFAFSEKENSFPFVIEGAANPSDSLDVDIGESSQFLSALLMSSVCVRRPVRIRTFGEHGRGYIDMTCAMMRSFGARVEGKNGVYTVSGRYTAREYEIEPDLSAASYFYALNRLLGTNVKVAGAGEKSLQSDGEFISLIKNFNGGRVDMSRFSDQALTLAAIAPYFDNPTEICGIAHIRRQECDRIGAIVKNLTAVGVGCEESADGVKIYPSQPHGAEIETFGDHRVAMSFALTGLRCDGIVIKDAEVCSKTFAEYFDVLDNLCRRLTV